MTPAEYSTIKTRERRAKFYAQGLNHKGEPCRRPRGRPPGPGHSLWRAMIASAKAGDKDAIKTLIEEFERRMDIANAAYKRRQDNRK